MKISVRNLEPTKVKLTVTVDPEEFNPYLDEARKEIAKQVNVPGFRKGHVPGKIIDQRIGFGAVAGEAVNNGVPELYSKALETKKIHPMAQPEIDVQDVPESAKDETKLKFVATVERRPDIELPALDGMEIEVAKAEVTDEDINNRLEALRQRFGTLVSVDRPAAKGDYANIDLNTEIDGETVDSQEGVSYELGSATMLDGLDEALEGLSAGEETSFEGTLEAGKHEGEKALIKVKVNSVKAEELPELNDEFASEASEFDTLDELKADIRKADGATAATIASFKVNESELDVYLDDYGYALYVVGTKVADNYAVVIGLGNTNAYGSETFGATLLLADGTKKEVTAKYSTDDNGNRVKLSANDPSNNKDRVDYDVTRNKNLVDDVVGDLVKYYVNKDGVYELTMAGLNAAKDAATGQWSDAYFLQDRRELHQRPLPRHPE